MLEYKRTITEEDYIRSSEFQYLNLKSGKKSLLNYKLRVPLLLAAIMLLVYVISDDRFLFLSLAVFSAVYSIVWLFVAKYVALHQIRKNIKKRIKKGEIPCPLESTLTFGDTSFTIARPTVTSTYEYSSINAVYVTSTDIYMTLSDPLVIVVMPYSMFPSVDEINNFIAFLSTKIDSSKFKS